MFTFDGLRASGNWIRKTLPLEWNSFLLLSVTECRTYEQLFCDFFELLTSL